MSNEFKVVCSVCQSEPEIVSDASGDFARCVSCGQRDSLEDAHRVAGEHFLYQAIPDLQKSVGQALKGNSFMKFTPEVQPRRSYRWHAVPLGS